MGWRGIRVVGTTGGRAMRPFLAVMPMLTASLEADDSPGSNGRPSPVPRPPQRRRPNERQRLGVTYVPCPRCGAKQGQNCDPRTLGRHYYHKARRDAWEAVR